MFWANLQVTPLAALLMICKAECVEVKKTWKKWFENHFPWWLIKLNKNIGQIGPLEVSWTTPFSTQNLNLDQIVWALYSWGVKIYKDENLWASWGPCSTAWLLSGLIHFSLCPIGISHGATCSHHCCLCAPVLSMCNSVYLSCLFLLWSPL